MADTPVPAQYEGGTHRTAYGQGAAALFVASAAFFVTQPFITHPTLVAGPQFNPAQTQPVIFHAPPPSTAPAPGINRPLVALAAQSQEQLKANVWGPQPPTASPQILKGVIWVEAQPPPQLAALVFAQQPAPVVAASLLPGAVPQWIPNQDPFQPQPQITRAFFGPASAPQQVLQTVLWVGSQDPRQVQPVIVAGFFDSPMFWVRPVSASPQASPEQRPSAVFGPVPPTATTPLIGQINAKPQDSPEQRPSWLQPAFFDQLRSAPPLAQIVSLLPDGDRQAASQGFAQTYSAMPPDTPAVVIGGGGKSRKRYQIKLGNQILEGSKAEVEALAREIAIREAKDAAIPAVVEVLVPAKKRKPAITASTQVAADVAAVYRKAIAETVEHEDDEEALLALLT